MLNKEIENLSDSFRLQQFKDARAKIFQSIDFLHFSGAKRKK